MPTTPPHTLTRWTIAVRVVAAVAGALVAVPLVVLLLLQVGPVGRGVARVALERAPFVTEASVDEVRGTWLTGIDLRGVRLTAEEHGVTATVDTARVRWALLPLLRRQLFIGLLEFHRPRLIWDACAPVPESPPSPASTWTVRLHTLTVAHGEASGTSCSGGESADFAASDVNLSASEVEVGARIRAESVSLSGGLRPPGTAPDYRAQVVLAASVRDGLVAIDTLTLSSPHSDVRGAGTVALTLTVADSTELHLRAAPFDFRDLQPYAGQWLVAEGRADAELSVRRTSARSEILGDLTLQDGGRATYDISWSPELDSMVWYRASIRTEALDPARLFTRAPAGAFDGSLEARIEGPQLVSASGQITVNIRDTEASAAGRAGSLTLDLSEGAGDVRAQADWLGWRARVEGTTRPFAVLPEYDVVADIDAPRPTAMPDAGVVTPLHGRLELSGAGFVAAEATATARLLLDQFDLGRETVGPIVLDARVDSGQAVVQAQGPVGGGRLTTSGRMTLGERPEVELREFAVVGVDAAGLVGDSTPSRLDLTVRGDAAGDGWRTLAGRFRASSDSLIYGRVVVDSLDVQGTLEPGWLVDATTRVMSNAGDVAVTLRFDSGDLPASVRLSNGRLSGVDLGPFSPDSAWTTELNGTFEGRFQGLQPLADLVGTGRLGLLESRIGEQPVDAGDVSFDLDRGRVRLASNARFPGGSLALRGSASPFDSIRVLAVDTFDARNVDLSAILWSSEWPGPFDGTVLAHARGRDLATLTGDLDVTVRAATVGQTEFTSGRISGRAEGGRLRVEGRVAGPWGTAEARGQSGTTGSTRGFDLSGTLDLSNLQHIRGDSSLSGHVQGTFSAEGDGLVPLPGNGFTLDSVRARGRAHLQAGTLRDMPFDSVALVAAMDAGVLRLDTGSAWSPSGTFDASGTFPLTSTSGSAADLAFKGTAMDVGSLGSWLGLEVFSVDSAWVAGSVTGPRDRLDVAVDLTALGLVANDARADRIAGSARARINPDGSLAELTTDLRARSVTAGPIEFDSTDVRLVKTETHYRLDLESLVDQRRHIRLVGSFDPIQNGAHVERFDLAVDGDRWSLESGARITLGPSPRVDQLVLSAGAQRIEVRGGLDAAGTQDLTASFTAVRAASIADLLGWEALDGTLGGTLELTGLASNPIVKMNLRADLKDGGADLGILSADATLQNRRLSLDAEITRPQGSGQVTLRGDTPLALTLPDSALSGGGLDMPDGPIDLTLRADEFALEWLTPFMDPAFFRDPGGRLTADVRALGTVQDPEMSGSLSMEGGRLGLTELGIGLTDGRFVAALEANQIRFETVSIRSGEGTLEASGTVTFERLVDPQLDLSARLDRFDGIRNRQAQAALSGDVTIKGAPLRPVVAGTLDLPSTEIHLDAQWSSPDAGTVELTEEDLRMLEETFGITEGGEPPRRGLYEAADLKLRVVMGRDTWARQRSNPEMALQFSGELTVEKRPDALLEASGTLLAVPGRSYIRQFGRRFQVVSGEVDFTGPVASARVDLTAEYAVNSRDNPGVPEVTISLTAQGTAETMSLLLSSSPSMENADIVSYIATGRPASEGFSGAGGSQGAIVGATAAVARDQLVGLFQRAAMSELGLEVAEIRSDGTNGTSLVLGRYISPRLYLGIVQPFTSGGTDQAATTTENSRAIEIEYEAFRWLILNLQRGGSRLGFFLKSRYAY